MDLITFLENILSFLNSTVVPFIIALAGLVFIWNAARYFIIQSAEEEARRKARALALWGIIAFVFLLSLWGIINIFVQGFGFDNNTPLNSDYVEDQGGSGTEVEAGGGAPAFDMYPLQ
jgi:hypothetical protein